MAADTSVSFATRQQGEPTVAEVGFVLQYPLGPVQRGAQGILKDIP